MNFFAFQDVPSTMYSFMKGSRFTRLNLKGTKCRIVYNHHRKTAKIGNRWRTFVQIQNLLLGTQIIQMQPLTLFYSGFICN